MRKPDNIIWSRQWIGIHWAKQHYHYNATCLTICLGYLTLRWHTR